MLTSCLYLLIWFTGCCLGSFLMVIGSRMPIHQSIVFPRSHCTNCHHTLPIFELIPVLSFLMQKGRCRSCQQKISILYPLVELLMGFVFLFIFFTYLPFPTEGLFITGIVAFGLIFIVSDSCYQLLPDNLMYLFLLWVLLGRLAIHPHPISFYVFSGLGFFSFFYLVYQVSSTPIGGGDVKLLGIIALLLGYHLSLVALLFASLSAILVCYPLMFSKKLSYDHPIPFAPFIFLGTFVAYYLQVFF